jgi:anti-sigma factor RsiW
MTTVRQELREYLLGQLPADAANALDARLFAEDDLLLELQNEQDALIEDFLKERLIESEAASFRAQIARSPALQERVRSLRILLGALERQSTRISHPAPARFPRFLVLISPALTIMLCFVIFLYFKEFRRNVKLSAQLLALSRAPQQFAHSMGENSVSVAFLSANVLRAPSAPPEFMTPATDSFLELQIELTRTAREEDTWDAEVRRGNEVVWKSSHIPMHKVGQEEFLALFIDAGDIRPGAYAVQYAPTSKPGASQSRTFRVIEPR